MNLAIFQAIAGLLVTCCILDMTGKPWHKSILLGLGCALVLQIPILGLVLSGFVFLFYVIWFCSDYREESS